MLYGYKIKYQTSPKNLNTNVIVYFKLEVSETKLLKLETKAANLMISLDDLAKVNQELEEKQKHLERYTGFNMYHCLIRNSLVYLYGKENETGPLYVHESGCFHELHI